MDNDIKSTLNCRYNMREFQNMYGTLKRNSTFCTSDESEYNDYIDGYGDLYKPKVNQ